jgi:hypothetical protein
MLKIGWQFSIWVSEFLFVEATAGAAAETVEIAPQWTAAASAIGLAVQADLATATVEIAPQWIVVATAEIVPPWTAAATASAAATAEIVPQWTVEATALVAGVGVSAGAPTGEASVLSPLARLTGLPMLLI